MEENMAVSSSDKTDSRNVNNQKSDEYRSQIESKEKKHRAEISRIRKQQYEEAQKTNNEHKKQVEQLRAAHQATVTERDKYFRDEMDKVNNMHRQKLRDQAEDYTEQMNITKDSASSEIKSTKEQQARARERLDSNYKNEITRMDEEFRDYANRTRETQQESYQAQKAKYTKDKESTVETLSDGHRQQLSKADRDLSNERNFRESEVKSLKDKMNEQAESMRKSFRNTLDRDRAFHEDVIEARDIEQKDSLETIKMRYGDALKEHTDQTNSSNDQFRTSAAKRMNDRIDSLEGNLADTEKQALGDKLKAQKFNEFEKNNLRREMKESLDLANEQKKLAIEAEREDSRKTIDKVKDQNQSDIHEKIRYYQNQISDMRSKHRVQMTEKDVMHELQANQQNKQTGTQVNNIKEQTAKEQKNLINYYEANLNDTKDNHRKDKAEFQAKYMEERNQSILSLNKKLQELEKQYAVEKEKEKAHHASQIEQMSFSHRVDKSRLEKKHKDTVENLQKSHARELQFTKATSENKLDEIQKQHREEMQRLQDRHTAEMASLASHKPKV